MSFLASFVPALLFLLNQWLKLSWRWWYFNQLPIGLFDDCLERDKRVRLVVVLVGKGALAARKSIRTRILKVLHKTRGIRMV